MAIGIHAAQKYNPDYLMMFDCDDIVSNQIAEFVNARLKERKNGWIVDKGYVFNCENNELNVSDDFNNKCGTSNIIRNDLFLKANINGVAICQRRVEPAMSQHYLTSLVKRIIRRW